MRRRWSGISSIGAGRIVKTQRTVATTKPAQSKASERRATRSYALPARPLQIRLYDLTEGQTVECDRQPARGRTPGQIATVGAFRHARTLFLLATMTALAAPTRAQTVDGATLLPQPSECDTDLEVIAILYAPENPTSSMALVGDKGSRLVRIGSWVADRRVIQMEARSLVLGPLDDSCLMRLTDRSPRRKVSPRRRVRSRRRR